jgi:hypothetical protein
VPADGPDQSPERDGLRRRLAERRAAGPEREPWTAAEVRTLARDRLIESRLTPNAISLTGLALNVAAAVLVTQRALADEPPLLEADEFADPELERAVAL